MLPTAAPKHTGLSHGDMLGYAADALSSGASIAVSFARPNDTTAYTAGDAVGAASAILTFAGITPTGSAPGRNLLITSAALRIDVTSVPSGMSTFRLHLYTAAPAAIADNAPWDLVAGDRTAYQGYIEFTAPADMGSTLWSQLDSVNHQVQLADGSTTLYGVLQTQGAYTPTALAVKTLTLRAISV
jgi:hypothetical protein